ncbi:MAG: copper ion binding protein, partial [Armatimonadota bacterium]
MSDRSMLMAGTTEITRGDVKRIDLPVEGMSCASCVARVEGGLQKTPGVSEAQVNFASERASVSFDPGRVNVQDLVAAVHGAGYGVPKERITIPVSGMSCASCVDKVEHALRATDGVLQAWVNLATEQATVEYVPGVATPEALRGVIRDAGYDPLAADENTVDREAERRVRELGA